MCGISGLIDHYLSESQVRDAISLMSSTLLHRGPELSGFYTYTGTGIASQRLKIIDLETGDQPIANETGRIWIVMNGEIYNYLELRVALEAKGHRFSTHSDTEVVIHLYEDHGVDCFNLLRGMFALAIIDTNKKSLILARDRYGIKPLFISNSSGRLAFASEIRALKTLPWLSDEWNYHALDAFLNLGYIPAGLSAYSDIRKMLPGTFEEWSTAPSAPALLSSGKYSSPQSVSREKVLSFEESAEALLTQLRDSLKVHMRSDVPVGVFLSGGVDSSTIVALLSEMGFPQLTTFSIGFDSAAHDELEYARLVSTRFGTRHVEKRLAVSDCIRTVENAVDLFDEPFADSSCIPTLELCRLAREEVTVALSGEGGDEIFAGYESYQSMDYWSKIDRIPRFLRASAGRMGSLVIQEGARGGGFVRRLGTPSQQRFFSLISTPLGGILADCFSNDFHNRLTSARLSSTWMSGYTANSSEEALSVDQSNYLPDDLLVKADRCSMAVSLETRVPFVDPVLLQYVAGLPYSYLRRGSHTKLILKEAVKNLLPSEILTLPKHGFGIPLRQWLSAGLKDILSSTFEAAAETGCFNAVGCKRLLDASISSKKGLDSQVWKVYCLARWIIRERSK